MDDNSNKIILHLCASEFGSDTLPYREANYDVRLITRDIGVENYHPPANVYGIIANPPCTMFSIARGTNAKKPRDLREGMHLVQECLRIIWECMYDTPLNSFTPSLKFWAIENPGTGMLRYFLGKPMFEYTPTEFGDNWTKRTALWGHFCPPRRTFYGFRFQKANTSQICICLRKIDKKEQLCGASHRHISLKPSLKQINDLSPRLLNMSKKLRFSVFHRDGFTCQYCGKRPPEVILEADHIVPRVEGGKDQLENLVTACFDCNRGKSDTSLRKTPEQVKINIANIKEKAEQLREFYKYQQQVEDFNNGRVERLADTWSDLWDGKFELNLLGRNSMKRFLKDLDPEEIEESLCIGAEKQPRDVSAAWRYACGVMWTKLRNKQDG